MPLTASLAAAVLCLGAGPLPPVPSPAPDPRNGVFDVAVLLGDERKLPAGHVEDVLAEATRTMRRLTGASVAFFGPGLLRPGSTTDDVKATANAWLQRQARNPPEAIVVFSSDDFAQGYGGWSSWLNLPPGSTNEFPAMTHLPTEISLAVVDGLHWYGRCGYDESLQHVSTTSFGGECRNTDGLVCEFNGTYWACPNVAGLPYVDLAISHACVVVHEFMHFYGGAGTDDHYGSPECKHRMGWPANHPYDILDDQRHCGVCPDVYERFPEPVGSLPFHLP